VKRIIVAILLFLPCLACEALPVFVQSKGASANANTSVAVNWTTTPTAGNWVVAGLVAGTGGGYRLTGADVGPIVQGRSPQGQGANNVYVYIYIYQSIGGTGFAFTNNGANTTSLVAFGAEYKMANPMLEVANVQNNNAGTVTASSGTFSTTFAPELCVAILGSRCAAQASDNQGLFTAPTNSFTIREQHTSTTNNATTERAGAFLERIATTTLSSITADATIPSAAWAGLINTWRELQGGAPLMSKRNRAFRGWHGTNPMVVQIRERK
jgi:hypothetical protein